MKKKPSVWQSILKNLKTILGVAVGEGADVLVDNVKAKVDKTIEETEQRLQKAATRAIRALSIFFVIIVGFIFALVGLGQYLSATVTSLGNGLGFVAIGVLLIIVVLVARIYYRE